MWYSILLFLYRRVAVVVITVGYGKQRTVRSGPRRATTSETPVRVHCAVMYCDKDSTARVQCSTAECSWLRGKAIYYE